MIVTGAARSVVVKLAYQCGFEAPLTITMLYLLGQSLSLGVYWIQKTTSNGIFGGVYISMSFPRRRGLQVGRGGPKHKIISDLSPGRKREAQTKDPVEDVFLTNGHGEASLELLELQTKVACEGTNSSKDLDIDQELEDQQYNAAKKKLAEELERKRLSLDADLECTASDWDPLPNGSQHGLSLRSKAATQWIERIPWYYKPVIPGILNLLNSTLRWLSLIFVAASVAEMLISGMELALSVVAARYIRKRDISNTRWMGVGFVTIGIILVSFADYHNKTAEAAANEVHYDDDNGNSGGDDEIDVAQKNYITGIVLIVLQCIFSVLQDLAEEVFMQASDFPPTLLLGMEGMFGLIFGLLIYICFGEKLGEDPMATIAILQEDPYMSAWLVGLPFLFLVTGIFNIKATEVTSSMTRNVWKNLRTLLVWIAALCIFYMSGNSDIGEAWLMPGSFYTLVGFMTMSGGIVVYYWHKKIEIEATDAMPLQRTDHEVV
eukprot:CAMPEP_0194076604 /NCGR_PEP_ID=MMETSP0149-20130528/3386_1 /TAXON_ID=122233 /ORGANISM="Chaetoceros debilis, Strain MM31A-1" /LENGTH=490 /DNA_ID=CAMNT_0038757399 /DNA_START=79 /DNA_END=1551 /DNA_ORIENTATION=+